MTTILLSRDSGFTCSVGSSCKSSHIYVSARFQCAADVNDDKELLIFYCGNAAIEKSTSSSIQVNWGWQLSLFGPPGQRRLRFCSTDGLFDIIASDSLPPASWERVLSVTVYEREIGSLRVQVSVNGNLVHFMHMEDIRAQRSDYICSTCITQPFSQILYENNDDVLVVGAYAKKRKRFCRGALDDPNDSQIDGISGSVKDIVLLCPGTELQHQMCNPTLPSEEDAACRTRAAPLRSFEQTLLWKPSPVTDSLLLKTLSLKPRFSDCIVSPSGPLSLICHDCGPTVYVEDAEVGQSTNFHKLSVGTSSDSEEILFGHTYRLEIFSGCDIFVYFSHNRVTIPPPSWISASHIHGTRVLGTIITEWKDGEAANQILLRAYETMDCEPTSHTLAFKLASLAKYYGFDGWLVNIEAPLPSSSSSEKISSNISKLCAFLKDLTKQVHSMIGDQGIVLWYDSIDAKTGTVRWQSELNDCNQVFFDQVDGIFLDYHWNEAKVKNTSTLAMSLGRCRDVFFGSDIWGRGSFGGEGFRGVRAAARAVKAATVTEDPHPLSFALFGPAWGYESKGGSTDVNLFRHLEEELWWGSDDKRLNSDQDGEYVKIPVEVLNPSGIPIIPSQKIALGGSISQAIALIGLAGWKVDESGGNGWSVESDDGMSSCFVTSFAWSWSSQVVSLPMLDLTEFDVCVEEEYCGTGPNVNDLYQLRVTILNESGNEISSWNSGELICSATWQVAKTIFLNVDLSARSLRIQHGGRDAENWAGHFGAKMRNAKVSVITPRRIKSKICEKSVNESADRFIDLVGGPRPAASSLPFSTSFNCGAGAAFFQDGRALSSKPWVDYATCDILPTYMGISSSISNNEETYLSTSFVHSTAWLGGTSLLVSSRDDSTQSLMKGKVKLFKLDIPVDRNKKIEIQLIHKTLSSHACELSPVLIFRSSNNLTLTAQKLSCEDLGENWTRSMFYYTVGDTSDCISELQLALISSMSSNSHNEIASNSHNEIVKVAVGQILVL